MRLAAHAWVLGVLVAAAPAARAQDRDFSKVEIQTQKLADNVYMLTGAGGNLGVCVGDDGVFLIDDQFAPLSDKIKAAIAALSLRPVRFVLNTHWHGDHTGGNESLGLAGAVIVAHDNVRKRMSVEQFLEAFGEHVPPSPRAALPIVTFASGVTFHLNGDEIEVFHVPPAHTDGDSVVHFTKADVIHAGDLFFNGTYPFIDLSSGGSVDGVIAADEQILAAAGPATKIIPGHGPLGGQAELRAFRDMLKTVRDRVRTLLAAGKTREQVIAAAPSKEFDATWAKGSLKPESFVGIVYADLSRKK